MMVTEKQECRACEVKFSGKVLLNFGEHEIVDFLDEEEVGRGAAPLELVRCEGCGLVQLRHTVDADTLYRKFFYRSSVNEQMRAALEDIVECVLENVVEGDAVLDIGSNDGELLLNYPDLVDKVGFEPAEALARESVGRLRARGNFEIIPNYFNAIEALEICRSYKVISAVAMFYDLDDPVNFLYDIKACLARDGIFVVQMNYLGSMIKNLAFDNIGHEHLCYYSLSSLNRLFERCGLEIYDIELNGVNGGSIRIYATHKDARLVEASVRELLLQESTQLSENLLKHFAEVSEATAKTLRSFLKELKKAGKRVYAYGASTRGMTLLQTVFKGERASEYIIAAAERDERKYGKRMAGLEIPIVAEELARREADYMLILPWHFWPSIQKREVAWMRSGGQFILPLPYPKVVRSERIGLVSHDLREALEMIKV